MTGRRLADRYELVTRLGAGGMAEVWESIDHNLGRRVAVKMLHGHLAADPNVLGRFRSEAQAAARLTHPGIVGIYDTVTTESTDAIIMELVSGRDLRSQGSRQDQPHRVRLLGRHGQIPCSRTN